LLRLDRVGLAQPRDTARGRKAEQHQDKLFAPKG